MKNFSFFIKKIFLKRWILSITLIFFLLSANFLIFTAVRSLFLTRGGYDEMSRLNKNGIFVSNLDPSNAGFDVTSVEPKRVNGVYDYIDKNFKYALHNEGDLITIPNDKSMDVPLVYMNKEYYDLNGLKSKVGKKLYFDYSLKSDKIPVFVGAGLSKNYPIGAEIKTEIPALGRKVTLKVQGILKKNECHANYYALNSMSYYNYSIIIPINKEFFMKANSAFKVDTMLETIIINGSKESVSNLSKEIHDEWKIKVNFNSQKENNEFFEDYYLYRMRLIVILTIIFLAILIGVSIWNAVVCVRLMKKDFTINLLVGMSYKELKKILYKSFAIIFTLNILVVSVHSAMCRVIAWKSKNALVVSYGFLGLASNEWLGVLAMILVDSLIGVIIVECIVKRIKKIPISLGVMQ